MIACCNSLIKGVLNLSVIIDSYKLEANKSISSIFLVESDNVSFLPNFESKGIEDDFFSSDNNALAELRNPNTRAYPISS